MRSRPLRASAWLLAHFAVGLATVLIARLTLGVLVWGALALFIVYVACAVDAGLTAQADDRASGGKWLVFTVALVFVGAVAPVVLSLLLRLSVEAFKVPSGSMCPTVIPGDHVFADKTVYRSRPPERGDVVIYAGDENTDFVKRVVAVGGDDVEITADKLILNGKAVPKTARSGEACEGASPFEEELGSRHSIAIQPSGSGHDFKGRVPEGTLFVLGDNRSNSHDSRHHGPISIESVKGKVTRLWLRADAPRWEPVH
jgi:signal peptidase I